MNDDNLLRQITIETCNLCEAPTSDENVPSIAISSAVAIAINQ